MSEMNNLISELLKALAPPKIFPPPGDFHSSNTAAFFGREKCQEVYFSDEEKFKHEFRGVGKVAGLALVYGSSWKLFLDIVPNCTEAMAHALYDAFFSNLPVFTRYDKQSLKEAQKNGYIKTFLQRLIYVDSLDHEKWNIRAKGERQVKNLPIQGAGSEIVKYVILKVFNLIDEHKLSRWVGTFLHKDYYTRILSVTPDQITPELVSDLDKQPKGNCKILVMSEGKVLQEFDRSIQLTMELINKHNLEFVF